MYLDTVTSEHLYFTSVTGEESILITKMNRVSGEVVSVQEFDGYWAGIAVNRDGEVLIGSSGLLMLSSGEEVVVEGDVSNIDW